MTRQFLFFRIFIVCISAAVIFYTALGISQQREAPARDVVEEAQTPRQVPSKRPEQQKSITINPIFLAAQVRCRHRRYFRTSRIKGGCWDSTLLAIH